MTTKTLSRPLGGEIYQTLRDKQGNEVTLSYNDLWMLIVCRTSLDGDWIRAQQASVMVADPWRKRELVDRLWQLEQSMGGLPEIPLGVINLHSQRAHHWFNKRPVLKDRKW